MNVFDFIVKDQKGNEAPLSNFKGKVLLIVNTATGCGFTPQYEGLQKLYDEYKDKGLEILDFPCNQFFRQAPGSDEEINQFCSLRYHTTFPRFKKVDVKGANAEPLFLHLCSQNEAKKYKAVKWNFTKFLVNKDGEVVRRFEPTETPAQIEEDIKRLLNE